jgi:heterodisulfide reductase subunit B2
MDYSYYPGCSLHAMACEYDHSVQAVFQALDASLHELEDWNCCGASSAHAFSRELSLALPARNLALAQKAGRDLVMPCAACFNRHKAADYELSQKGPHTTFLEDTAGFHYDGSIQVRPLLEVVLNDIGLEKVRALVSSPLKGLKAVGYYGCLLVRPPEITRYENPDQPEGMNQLLEALGAEPRPWSYATECCGGGLTLTKSALAARLVGRLVERAREAGAQAIVTSCPLCQMNLEMRQAQGEKMPIFYFTELMGLAFGIHQSRAWFKKHLIDPTRLLTAIRV